MHPAQKKSEKIPSLYFLSDIPKNAVWGILIFTALLYFKALFNNFANWDDDDYILKNPYIRDFSINGIKNIFTSFYCNNYHPLTTLTYLVEFKFFGINPFPYHLINVLLHLLNTYLVFKLTLKLSEKRITAFIVSLLFAVHPMHVESVAWLSERKDVLYSLFYLLSLNVYLKYIKTSGGTKYYIWTLILFVFSLFSKSAAVTLPVLLFATDIYCGRKINFKLFIEKVPFLLFSILFGMLAIVSQDPKSGNLPLPYTFIERIFLLTYSVSFYIVKLFVPFNLSAMHYYPNTNGSNLPWQYYASLPFIILLLAFILMCKSSYIRKEIIFGIIFFLITISVMLQLLPVGSCITAERYTYISYIGLFYITGQLFADIKKRLLKNIAVILLLLFIVMFSYQTWKRTDVWKDGNVLFTDVIKKYPDNYSCYRTRANFRCDKGDLQGALLDYNKTLEFKLDKTTFISCIIYRGDICNKLGDYNNALLSLNCAIKMDSAYADAYFFRGTAYDGLNKINLALNDYDKAIKLNPVFTQAFNNRAILKAKTGDLSGALNDVNNVIKIEPDNVEAYNNRGNIKTLMKDYKGSVEDFSYSLKLKPDENIIYYNRGISRFYIGDKNGACEDWVKAVSLGYKDAIPMVEQYCKYINPQIIAK